MTDRFTPRLVSKRLSERHRRCPVCDGRGWTFEEAERFYTAEVLAAWGARVLPGRLWRIVECKCADHGVRAGQIAA